MKDGEEGQGVVGGRRQGKWGIRDNEKGDAGKGEPEGGVVRSRQTE